MEIQRGRLKFKMDATGRWELLQYQPHSTPRHDYVYGVVKTRDEKIALAEFLLAAAHEILKTTEGSVHGTDGD